LKMKRDAELAALLTETQKHLLAEGLTNAQKLEAEKKSGATTSPKPTMRSGGFRLSPEQLKEIKAFQEQGGRKVVQQSQPATKQPESKKAETKEKLKESTSQEKK
jgi:hypothetical protein